MKEHRLEKYDQIFLPGSPIKERRYLVGREQEIADLKKILTRPGQHAVVIGDRGVGKTSVVKQVLRDPDFRRDHEFQDVWRTCDPNSSFSLVFENLLKDCGIDFRNLEEANETTTEGELKITPAGIGLGGKRVKKYSEKYTSPPPQLAPWTIFQGLAQFPSKFILVLDEYDAIHLSKDASNFHQHTAYTMKHLADHNDRCDSRIVVVGVASSSAELLGKHESVQRSAREIYLRPLRREHIIDFLNTAESDLEIELDAKVKERLAYGSLGYPYFVHLVGLECIEAMLSRDKHARKVTWDDFVVAIDRAVDRAFRAELSKYKRVYKTADQTEMAVIEALAMIELYPKRAALRQYVCALHRDITEEKFEAALNRLTQEKRFLYMSRRTDEIRFLDPLMKAFLRERILTYEPRKAKRLRYVSQPSFFDSAEEERE